MVPSVIVTDDMLIALADDIIKRKARLALVDQDNNPDLYGMAKNPLLLVLRSILNGLRISVLLLHLIRLR